MIRLGFGPWSEVTGTLLFDLDYGLGLAWLGALCSSTIDEPARPDGVTCSEGWAYKHFDGDIGWSLPKRQRSSGSRMSVAQSHHEGPWQRTSLTSGNLRGAKAVHFACEQTKAPMQLTLLILRPEYL